MDDVDGVDNVDASGDASLSRGWGGWFEKRFGMFWVIVLGCGLFWGGLVMGVMWMMGMEFICILVGGGAAFLFASVGVLFVMCLCISNEGDWL